MTVNNLNGVRKKMTKLNRIYKNWYLFEHKNKIRTNL